MAENNPAMGGRFRCFVASSRDPAINPYPNPTALDLAGDSFRRWVLSGPRALAERGPQEPVVAAVCVDSMGEHLPRTKR